MSMINKTGFYHGVIVDAGLSQSSGGFPQEVLALKALEVYDSDTEAYLPANPEADEITAYLVLIDSKDRETKNCQQLKKIVPWDGASLVALSEMNMADAPIAFRVEEREYNQNTTLQVTWIDTIDASPTRTVQKLDVKDVQALQARYASVLAATKALAKPASAPSTAVQPVVTPVAAPAPVVSAPAPVAKPKGRPPKAPKVSVTTTAPVGKCTADEAYSTCYSLKRADVTDDVLNETWLKVVGSVNVDESKITGEQWFEIKETVLKQVSAV